MLAALHHVTCVCADARRTVAYYRDELGFSLVKKTVNFDDPHSYHLYFGDGTGAPGTLITFFEWPRSSKRWRASTRSASGPRPWPWYAVAKEMSIPACR